jgi:hypothetical protein
MTTSDDPTSPSESAEPPESAGDDDVDQEWGLLDAEAQNEAQADDFPIPSAEERHALRSGDMVKLVFVLDPAPADGPNAERMWVEVAKAHADGSYEGWLTNRPVVITGLRPSAVVAFESRHVAGIALREAEVTFDVRLRAVVSTRALKLHGPPGWAGRDEPVAQDDSGWSVTAGDEDDAYFTGDPATVTQTMTLGELADRFPSLVEVFQAGAGEWVYRPEHRRYVRLRGT